MSLLYGNRSPRSQHLQPSALSDQSRKALGSTHSMQESEGDFRQSEHSRTLLGNANIACPRYLQPAAPRVSVYSGDDLLLGVFQPHQCFVAVQAEEISKLRRRRKQ